jgi:NAD(P)-dependent dehydrogenase (short-subunit alcohol dehydrogenase family)
MQISFKDKVVLVAGGTGGLGHAVSLAFLAEGAKVVVTYRNENGLASLKSAAGAQAAAIDGIETDVTAEADGTSLIEDIVAKYGRLDVLVNTVGAYAGGLKLWETDAKTFDRMLDLNLRSGFVLTRAAVRAMLKQGSGAVVNVAARAAVDHGAGASAYAASKAAAVAMMDSLAADLKGTGVRVNSVLPSIIDTAVNRQAMPDADFGVWPKPEEIASVILFLANDAAQVIHGAAIPVYGKN